MIEMTDPIEKRTSPPTLSTLPDKILNHILELVSPFDHKYQTEIRACHCLEPKVIPFREGDTSIIIDETTGTKSRQSISPCRLDSVSLGPWCCKQNLTSSKYRVPAFALTCSKLLKLFQKLPQPHHYVYCTEHCLRIAIRRLTNPDVMMFKDVVFVECAAEGRDEAQFVSDKLQVAATWEVHQGITYRCSPDQQVVYTDRSGVKHIVWMKVMTAIKGQT